MDDMLARLEYLNEVGSALSREKDIDRLLESILVAAKHIARADGGTLYRVGDDHQSLRFEIIRTDSLGIAMGGSTGRTVPFAPIPLFGDDGAPNVHNVAACAVNQDRTVNIEDAYAEAGFDFSGTRRFDRQTGYHSRSFLTVPMKNHEDEIIGVLQLINARDASGAVHPFSDTDQRLAESLASQAAVVLTNRLLISHLEHLFESFINLINAAIDDKSPYTGGHCERVPVLTTMLADAACDTTTGPLAGFGMDDAQRYELKIAGLLHDCGKVTTPVHVVDKATKLETIFDRMTLAGEAGSLLRIEEEIRTAIADAAAVMSSIYDSFRDGEKIDPAVVDIGIGCWLEKHAPGSLPEKDAVMPEEERLLAELAGLSAGVSTDDSAHRMEQILQRLLEIEQAGALAIDREHERRMQDLDSTMEGLGLATRVEAKRLDEAQEEIAALREACTLALRVMEQKNRATVLTTAKFVDVKFDQEDIAVLRAALEKKP